MTVNMADGTLRLEDLSPAQRKDFERALRSGGLSEMLEAWEPWWISEVSYVVARGVVFLAMG